MLIDVEYVQVVTIRELVNHVEITVKCRQQAETYVIKLRPIVNDQVVVKYEHRVRI